MKKKSQLTLILLAVIVLVIAAVFIYNISSGYKIKYNDASSRREVEYFAREGYGIASECLLERLGTNGGEIELKDGPIQQINAYRGYIQRTISKILGNFSVFKGKSILSQESKANISDNEKDVSVYAEHKITIEDIGKREYIGDFYLKHNIRYKYLSAYRENVNKPDMLKLDKDDVAISELDDIDIDVKIYQVQE